MSANASLSSPYNIPAAGSAANYGQGGGYIVTGARDIADAKRMMATGYVPTASYPDGYLGTVNSRREDRMFDAVKRRVSDRSYSRGVHKGEHIDPSDYYWTKQVNPTIALEYEARGRKWTQQQSFIGTKLVDDGRNLAPMSTPQRFATAQMAMGQDFPASDDDQRRKQQMQRYLPRWT